MASVSIKTAEEFVALMQGGSGYGSSGAYLEATLENDIDFADMGDYYNFTGGTYGAVWYLNFDGKGHKIKNIAYLGSDNWTLFGTSYGMIKDVTFEDVSVTSAGQVHFLTQYNHGTFYNVHISGYIQGGGAYTCVFSMGGANGKATLCTFGGTFYSTAGTAMFFTQGYISGCGVNADLYGNNINLWWDVKAVSNSYFIGNAQCTGFVLFPYNSPNRLNYIVVKSSLNPVKVGYYASVYYDADVASAGGVSVIEGGTAAATAELKNLEWWREKGAAV